MWTLVLAACAKHPAETAAAEVSDADGPIAGPRAVVEEAPPEPLPADTPGGGPIQPYVTAVRKAVGAALAPCLPEGAAPVQPALITATIGADGELRSLELKRGSGDEAYDQCLQKAFRTAHLPPPPTELLTAEGAVVTPDLVFR